ncbi:MAG TPA: imidazole glycerol phosphate synthase subunit HisF [Anaerovoracaceae bacterium]|nr:imidazole glycerol phosphate synthase subunit HisF [Anaerovoracaceae bacterium]
MKAKRIIPCLDICKGKVVKGVNFVGLREVGNPLDYALEYAKQGADEIVFLDIAASAENRADTINLIKEASKEISIPIVAGGGIGSVEDIGLYLQAGASKVTINSAAVKNPQIIREGSSKYGSKKIVVAIDGKKIAKDRYNVMISGGRVDTGIDLMKWAREAENLGAGEILLTSMDADGVKCGFDIDMLKAVCSAVKIPVIASGGCGTVGHFIRVFKETACDAALAASIFHYGDLTVDTVKRILESNDITVRNNGGGVCA